MRITFEGGPLAGQGREIPAADGTDRAKPGTLALIYPYGHDPGDPHLFPKFGGIFATGSPPRTCPHRTVVYRNGAAGVWEYVHPEG